MYARLADLERHCAGYADWFSAVDDELYRCFRENPGHDSLRSTYAKVTILNRVYMTGLERSSSDTDPAAIIARLLNARGAEVDQRISAVRGMQVPTRENLAGIAALHGWVVQDVLAGAGVGRPVSFVSKYLHFHASVVPIYDGLACKALGRYTRLRFGRFVATSRRLPLLPDQMQSYRWLCARFVEMWMDVQESRPGTTVKELDHHLWQLGAGR